MRAASLVGRLFLGFLWLSCGGEPAEEPSVTLSGHVQDILSERPLEGVQICLLESPVPCATSVADGSYSLSGVPAYRDVFLSYQAGGYYPQLLAYHTAGRDDAWVFNLASRAAVEAQARLLGLAVEPEAGQIAFAALQPDSLDGRSGIAVALSPPVSPPVYHNELLLPDQRLVATSTAGTGLIPNVPPGDYALRFSEGCTPRFGFPPEAGSDALAVLVVRGTSTFVAAECP